MRKAAFDEWLGNLRQKRETPLEAYQSNNARRFFNDGRAVVMLVPKEPLGSVSANGPEPFEIALTPYTYERSRLVQNGLLYWVVKCDGEEMDRWRA